MSKTPISSIGEFGLIEHLTKNIECYNASSLVGVGDDAAVIDHFGKQTVISTDLLVEDIHFDLAYTPLKHLGYKSVVVNISDICAMGASPTHITVSVAISSKYTVEALTELYEGIYRACAFYQVDLVGGDTCSSTRGLTISITAIGEVTPSKFVKRSTAQVGDLICVTGDIGAAYVGLVVLEREKQVLAEMKDITPQLTGEEYVIGRLLKPEARTDIVEWMNEKNIQPTSMIDISDGLSSELLHICRQSDVGCMIYEEKLPISEQIKNAAFKFTLDPTTCALHGGEDYELLFTIAPTPENLASLDEHNDIHIIGNIVPSEKKIHITSKGNNIYPLTAQGWNAFNIS